MDRIENYIKSLSKNVYLSPKEMEDFKDEIRNHLIDTVNELQQQGKSEEESIAIALNRFGAEKFINRELRKVVQFQNKFRNSMLRVSGIFLAVSLLFLVFYQFLEQRNTTDFDRMQLQYHQMEEKMKVTGTITNEEIEAFFSNNKRVLQFVYVSKADSQGQRVESVFPESIAEEQRNIQPYLSYPLLTEHSNIKWDIKIGLNSKALFSQTPNVVFLLAIASFAAYWLLFGLWNIMNAYRMSRLTIVWAILFFTLNVFAYLLFKLDLSIKMKRLKLIA